jgi:TDG/mug DNA glycosylase family protein
LAQNLKVVFCGINPGLHSASVGHHFAHPSNRFWRILHLSGFTPHQLEPAQDLSLPQYGLGLTNIVERPSAEAAELSTDELIQGRARLVEKIESFMPLFLAVLGLGAYRKAFELPHSKVGQQPQLLGRARVWLLPNPSGLNAHYSINDLSNLFQELRSSVTANT